ncbi:MAG: PilZ domain-containing protein [Acidobacteriaceae bacterium]
MDARTGRRFPVHIPVRVGDTPASAEHIGTTENISSSGAYFWLDTPPEIGSIIECEMTIPSKTIGAKTDVTLRCLARVIRTDAPKKGSQTGVACVIDSYEFVRPKMRTIARSNRSTKVRPKMKVRKPKPRTK